jgi:LysM domain
MSAGIGRASGTREINVTRGINVIQAQQAGDASRRPGRPRLRLVWSAPAQSSAHAVPGEPLRQAAPAPASDPQRAGDPPARRAAAGSPAPVTRSDPVMPHCAPARPAQPDRRAPVSRSGPATRPAPPDRPAPVTRSGPAARPAQPDRRAPVSQAAPAARHARPARQQSPRSAGLRLTRRGRLVLATFTTLAAATTATLVWMATASGAAASSQGMPARSPYAGMTQIVVRPGQTLWSVAATADPSASSWAVVQQIMDVNSLTSTNIQAGQLLWVPGR